MDSFDQFLRGIDLFNRQEFYDCHDTIEEIWLEAASDEQPFLQGIIQSAVAFHHYQQGNWGAARSMFRLALEKLEPYPEIHEGIRLGDLIRQLKCWREALDQAIAGGHRIPIPLPFPRIALSSPRT